MIWTALLAARSFLAKVPWQVWLVVAVTITAIVWGNHRFDEGYAKRSDEQAAAEAEAARQAQKASDTAGEQRAVDTIRNHEAERARTDAIAANPDDPRLGLSCQRLRSAGIDAPPACEGR